MSSGLYQATFSEGAWSTWTLVETTEVIRTCPQGPNMRIFGHVMAHEKTVGDTDSLLIATYDGKLMRVAVTGSKSTITVIHNDETLTFTSVAIAPKVSQEISGGILVGAIVANAQKPTIGDPWDIGRGLLRFPLDA